MLTEATLSSFRTGHTVRYVVARTQQQYVNMLFVLGIVKISTGPRTLHIIFNTSSTASRAHSANNVSSISSNSNSNSCSCSVSISISSLNLVSCQVSQLTVPGSCGLPLHEPTNCVRPVCIDIRLVSPLPSWTNGPHSLCKQIFIHTHIFMMYCCSLAL